MAWLRLLGDGDEEGTGVLAPAPVRVTVVRDEGAGELVDVIVIIDLSEQIPPHGVRLEGIEDHIPAVAVVELPEIASLLAHKLDLMAK